MVTEALAAVTEEEGSEVEEDGILGETVAVVTGSGAVVVAAAMATTEGHTNAASAKLLITEVPTCGLIRLAVTPLGWSWFLLAGSEKVINVWLVGISIMIQTEFVNDLNT